MLLHRKKPIKVGSIILNEDNDHMVIIRGNYSNKWNVPKGTSEHGESIRQTAVRELLEETGYKFEISKYDVPVRIDRVYLYILHVPLDTVFKPIDTVEIGDIKWIHVNDIEHIENKAKLLTKVLNYTMNL